MMMFVVTLGGVFIISTLIGVLTSGIENKIEELRKGRSRVIETGHTVILGWSPQIFTIVSELQIANQNQRRSCIVILADKDKVEMEDEIRAHTDPKSKTRIVCRTGSPINLPDLEIVSIHSARAVMILPSGDEQADAQTIKSILAITNNPNRRAAPYHIVAQIKDSRNIEAARMVGQDEAEIILTSDLISRIIAQTCRQSGLSIVYTELFDFSGDEIYFKEEPALTGKTFHEILAQYQTSTVIGLSQQNGAVLLNPPMDTVVQAGDQVIAISADDDTIVYTPPTNLQVQPGVMVQSTPPPPAPERTLLLGWKTHVPLIINTLDAYVAPGSEVTVVADFEHGDRELTWHCSELAHQKVKYLQADTTDRRVLDAVQPQTYDHVIVLSYSDSKSVQEADACTLITLLHLRRIFETCNLNVPIVSEMLDSKNRDLAEVTRADDFIVSDRLISLMMAQVSENKALNKVFTNIFDIEGAEIYLKPARQYVQLNRPVNFYTVTESAAQRGEVAIGYRLKAEAGDAAKSYGVHINPNKAEMVHFTSGDRVIVLAED